MKIHWIKDLDIDEISGVDLAANRTRFTGFKNRKGTPGMNVHRRRKQDDMPAEAPVEDEVPEGEGEPMVEEGVSLYPWAQSVAEMSAAFSLDDGPRVAALLLAKYGEGEGGSIKLPSDLDPIEAAKTAIDEAKGLMKENPLLRPEGNTKATTPTKRAVKSALREVLSEIFSGKKAAAVVEDEVETDPVQEQIAKLQAEIADLKKPKPGAKPAVAKKPDVEEDEGDEDADEEEESTSTEKKPDEAIDTEGSEQLEEIMKAIQIVGKAVKKMDARLEAVEKKAKRSKSAAVHDEGTGDAEDGKYFSTMLGGHFDEERVEPYLTKSSKRKGSSQAAH